MHWARLSGLCSLLLVGWGCEASKGEAAPKQSQQAARFVLDERFGAHWHDGKAELAGYELVVPRYGELREGTAVTIFVTEPFLKGARVKPERNAGGSFQVMKLNLVEDFTTGIYDYNTMTSVFVAMESVHARPAGTPTKVSFSSQEWCGHVYQQVLFDEKRVRYALHSYFEGEADDRGELAYPRDGFAEDVVLLWARGMAGPRLEVGQSVTRPALTGLMRSRLQHVPLAWEQVELSREPTTTLALGERKFEVDTYNARFTSKHGSRTWTVAVEHEFPHRIVRWSRDDGLKATLLSSKRLAYWKLNGKGKESLREQLGLAAGRGL